MADDYAVMIWEEFSGPVDVLGISTYCETNNTNKVNADVQHEHNRS